ncbi:MAG: hypothetical protein IT287_07320 [Bdellovibrionaceae bacterium]|nr:hypothetical protein [Pseudobdellovibrionaceae bacterium]
MKKAFLLYIACTLSVSSTWASYDDTEVTSFNEEVVVSQNQPKLCSNENLSIQECATAIKEQKESLDEQRADTKFLHGYCLSTMRLKGMSTYEAESTCAYLL